MILIRRFADNFIVGQLSKVTPAKCVKFKLLDCMKSVIKVTISVVQIATLT